MEREGKVWVPDVNEGFRLGQICDIGADTITVQPVNSKKLITAPYDRVYPAEHQDEKDVSDNCALMFLNEATLLQNLRVRYKKEKIYTYVANILLAVNPYHDMKDLYSQDIIKKYHGKSLGVLPPHIFAIADKAYRDMRSFKQSQSIIVSGESGAGKTESTKYILRYLTDSWGSGTLGHIEQRIVEANPLLESFGNAKTLRNINSSRFGKYVEVHFNEKCTVVGGFISHYLLEKSRVCTQSNGERNYHVFYRLCSGAPADLKNKLGLDKAENFNYLNRGAIVDPHLDDKTDFKRTMESMDKVGFSADEKANIFRVVAAVMHVGNITFEENHEDKKGGSMVSASCEKSIEMAAKLLGVELSGLKTGLTSRMMQAPNMGTLIKVPLKTEQACAARDALAKALYSKLFDHTVAQVNQCFPFKSSQTYIGVLDIAGFEYFQVNSFEQFCINYCNEKLQQFFNDRILKQEQELYTKEGLGVGTINFVDNQDCIDLIEAKTVGILDLLDEESKLPKSTAEHFTVEVHEKHKGHFRLAIPRKSHLVNHRNLRDSEGFLIRHFAGAVCYHTAEFIEKNNDALHSDLEDLIKNSKDLFVKALYPSAPVNTTASKFIIQHGGQGRAPTRKLALDSIGSKFRTQLNELMEKLDNTGANFIRCIKPNSKMASQDFEGGLILSQLQCAGMVSVLNLMQQGFPSRTHFRELYKMYQQFLPPQLARLDPRIFCQALFHALGMKKDDFKFGMTKIFFRPGKFAEFDQMMKSDPENLKDLVNKVQHFIIQTRWKRAIFCSISVQKLARKIQYRAEACIKIQKSVRMFLALCKHRPRYQGIMKIRKLQVQTDSMSKLVDSLRKDKDLAKKQVQELILLMDAQIQKIKNSVMPRDQIENVYNDLVDRLSKQVKELENRVAVQRIAEEEERLRKLQEQMELERKRKEEEERQRRQEEEERKMKMAFEERRKHEEEEARKREEEERKQREKEEKDRKLQEEKRKAEEEEAKQVAMQEQERRDRELALHLAQDPSAVVNETGEIVSTEPSTSGHPIAKRDEITKKYDLTKWKYAELRDTINTSCDVELLLSCKEEFHRRLKAYHHWKNKNKSNVPGNSGAPQRAPRAVIEQAEQSQPPPRPEKPIPFTAPPVPPRRPQRYFRVPFQRPTEQFQQSEYKKQGWWYAHFDGQWIARQLEIHPGAAPVMLVAGKDDMDICELSLEETGLTRRQGAEVTQREFEDMWLRCGGSFDDFSASSRH